MKTHSVPHCPLPTTVSAATWDLPDSRISTLKGRTSIMHVKSVT
jgi:hypothetical protein